jgi:hypothetical protein
MATAHDIAQHATVQGSALIATASSAPWYQSLAIGLVLALFTWGLQQLTRFARLEARLRELERKACPFPVGDRARCTRDAGPNPFEGADRPGPMFGRGIEL